MPALSEAAEDLTVGFVMQNPTIAKAKAKEGRAVQMDVYAAFLKGDKVKIKNHQVCILL